jgi:hypothetical protein
MEWWLLLQRWQNPKQSLKLWVIPLIPNIPTGIYKKQSRIKC